MGCLEFDLKNKGTPQGVRIGASGRKAHNGLPEFLSKHRPSTAKIAELKRKYQAGISFLENFMLLNLVLEASL